MFSWTRFVGSAWKQAFTGASTALLLASLAGVTSTQAQPTATRDIYTCVDARGRKLTSDRPIPECSDREQKLLNASGTLKAKVAPTLTALERLELEAKAKAEQEERARIIEERRRDRALLIRYPNKAVHDKERAQALAQIGVVRQAAAKRVDELLGQQTAINQEMEFYRKDPSKAPPSVRRQVDEVAQSLAVQGRFIADQDAELRRVNGRFDEEQMRLKLLWAMQSGVAPIAAGKTR
ncbi:MAG: DUF4124 domain-containing protein [Burkholderiaceae bacterium]|nr:DUF4124 domain-containing protein [Burkholderiaceae bacterium]